MFKIDIFFLTNPYQKMKIKSIFLLLCLCICLPLSTSELINGLFFTIYEGYHNEIFTYTTTAPISTKFNITSGVTTDMTDISTATLNSINITNSENVYFTVEWIGQLYTGSSSSGLWSFTTTTDDGSYLWIDDILIVYNGGIHPTNPMTGRIFLLTNTYHTIRILYGQSSKNYAFRSGFRSPDMNKASTLTNGYYYCDSTLLSRSKTHTLTPTEIPTLSPTYNPTLRPTNSPSIRPTKVPTTTPSLKPSWEPSEKPTKSPTMTPTWKPSASNLPTKNPSMSPIIYIPSVVPSYVPSIESTTYPTTQPSNNPTKSPTIISPTVFPTYLPSTVSMTSSTPITQPTEQPIQRPISEGLTVLPTYLPSIQITLTPTIYSPNTIESTLSPILYTDTMTMVPSRLPTTTSENTYVPSLLPSNTPIIISTTTVSPSTDIIHTIPSVQPIYMPSILMSTRSPISPITIQTNTPTSALSSSPSQTLVTTYPSSSSSSSSPSIISTTTTTTTTTTNPTIHSSDTSSPSTLSISTQLPSINQPTVDVSISISPSISPAMNPFTGVSSSSKPSTQPINTPIESLNPSYGPIDILKTNKPTTTTVPALSTNPIILPSIVPSIQPTIQSSVPNILLPTIQPPTRTPTWNFLPFFIFTTQPVTNSPTFNSVSTMPPVTNTPTNVITPTLIDTSNSPTIVLLPSSSPNPMYYNPSISTTSLPSATTPTILKTEIPTMLPLDTTSTAPIFLPSGMPPILHTIPTSTPLQVLTQTPSILPTTISPTVSDTSSMVPSFQNTHNPFINSIEVPTLQPTYTPVSLSPIMLPTIPPNILSTPPNILSTPPITMLTLSPISSPISQPPNMLTLPPIVDITLSPLLSNSLSPISFPTTQPTFAPTLIPTTAPTDVSLLPPSLQIPKCKDGETLDSSSSNNQYCIPCSMGTYSNQLTQYQCKPCVYSTGAYDGIIASCNSGVITSVFGIEEEKLITNPKKVKYTPEHNLIILNTCQVYFKDMVNNTIHLIAGSSIHCGEVVDGMGDQAVFYDPQGFTLDTVNHIIYIADRICIRIVTYDGVVSTIYNYTTSVTSNGNVATITFQNVVNVVMVTTYGESVLYIAESGSIPLIHRVRVDSMSDLYTGSVVYQSTTITTTTANNNDNNEIISPIIALSADSSGSIYFSLTNAIYRMTYQSILFSKERLLIHSSSSPSQSTDHVHTHSHQQQYQQHHSSFHSMEVISDPRSSVTLISGSINTPGYTDGPITTALYNHITDLTIDPNTNTLYVADSGNQAIRVIQPTAGIVTTAVSNQTLSTSFIPTSLTINPMTRGIVYKTNISTAFNMLSTGCPIGEYTSTGLSQDCILIPSGCTLASPLSNVLIKTSESPYVYITNINSVNIQRTSLTLSVALQANSDSGGILTCLGTTTTTTTSATSEDVSMNTIIQQGISVSFISTLKPVILTVSNLIPITTYSISCHIQLYSNITNTTQHITSFTTACCKSITFTNTPMAIYGDPSHYSSPGGLVFPNKFTFTYQVTYTPKASITIVPHIYRITATGPVLNTQVYATSPIPLTYYANNIASFQPTGALIIRAPADVIGPHILSLQVMGESVSEYETTYNTTFTLLPMSGPQPPPQVISAFFDEGGYNMYINFDMNTDQAGIVNNSWNCSALFLFLGVDSSICSWVNSSTVIATIDSTSTLIPGNSIIVKPFLLRAACTTTNKALCILNEISFLPQQVPLSPPMTPIIPIVNIRLSGGSICDPLIVDATSSSGNGGRSWLSIEWTVYVDSILNPEMTLYLNSISSISSIGRISRPITIPASLLNSGKYQIVLKLTNIFLESQSTVSTITISGNRYTPSIQLIDSDVITIKPSDSLSIKTITSISSCSDPATKLSFEWSLTSLQDTSASAIRSTSLSPREFILPPYTLKVGSTYMLQQVVSSMLKNQILGSNMVKITIKVVSTVVTARIKGSPIRQLPIDQPNVLDASISQDENYPLFSNPYPLNYVWTCQLITVSNYGSACNIPNIFDETLTSVLPTFAQPLYNDITIPPNYLLIGDTYEFKVHVFTHDGRSSSNVVIVQPSPAGSPLVSIDSTITSVTEGLPFSLSGTVTANSDTDVRWSVFASGYEDHIIYDTYKNFTSTQVIGGIQVPLSIPYHLLQPKLYVFRLHASSIMDISRSSSSDITIKVIPLPQQGFIDITPITGGYALETLFTITALNWICTDPSGYPLTYSYFYQLSPDTPEITIASNTQISYVTTTLPPGYAAYDHNITIIVRIYNALGGFTTSSNTVHVVTSATVDVGHYVTSNIQSAFNNQNFDLLYQGVGSGAAVYNQVICTSAPNCTALYRAPCTSVPNTCGSCISGYNGLIGPANTPCTLTLELLSVNATCEVDEECITHSCMEGLCADRNKVCASNSADTICSGHGTCNYYSPAGESLYKCSVTDPYCTSKCICKNGYGGVDCSLTTAQLHERDVTRYNMCQNLLTSIQYQNPSDSMVQALTTSILTAYSPSEVVSADTLSICTQATTALSSIITDKSLPDASVSSVPSYFMHTISSLATTPPTSSSAKVNVDQVDSILNQFQRSYMQNLVVGQEPVAFISDNVRVSLYFNYAESFTQQTLMPPISEADYGNPPPTITLPTSGISMCLNGHSKARISVTSWNQNIYTTSPKSVAPALRFSILKSSPPSATTTTTAGTITSGLENITSIDDEKYAYYITLPFSAPVTLNLTTILYELNNSTNVIIPACTLYDASVGANVACKGCNISDITYTNVTYRCTDMTLLCNGLSPPTTTTTTTAPSTKRALYPNNLNTEFESTQYTIQVPTTSTSIMTETETEKIYQSPYIHVHVYDRYDRESSRILQSSSTSLSDDEQFLESKYDSGSLIVGSLLSIFNQVQTELLKEFSKNPFNIDPYRARGIITFTVLLFITFCIGFIYFRRWDMYDKYTLLYLYNEDSKKHHHTIETHSNMVYAGPKTIDQKTWSESYQKYGIPLVKPLLGHYASVKRFTVELSQRRLLLQEEEEDMYMKNDTEEHMIHNNNNTNSSNSSNSNSSTYRHGLSRGNSIKRTDGDHIHYYTPSHLHSNHLTVTNSSSSRSGYHSNSVQHHPSTILTTLHTTHTTCTSNKVEEDMKEQENISSDTWKELLPLTMDKFRNTHLGIQNEEQYVDLQHVYQQEESLPKFQFPNESLTNNPYISQGPSGEDTAESHTIHVVPSPTSSLKNTHDNNYQLAYPYRHSVDIGHSSVNLSNQESLSYNVNNHMHTSITDTYKPNYSLSIPHSINSTNLHPRNTDSSSNFLPYHQDNHEHHTNSSSNSSSAILPYQCSDEVSTARSEARSTHSLLTSRSYRNDNKTGTNNTTSSSSTLTRYLPIEMISAWVSNIKSTVFSVSDTNMKSHSNDSDIEDMTHRRDKNDRNDQKSIMMNTDMMSTDKRPLELIHTSHNTTLPNGTMSEPSPLYMKPSHMETLTFEQETEIIIDEFLYSMFPNWIFTNETKWNMYMNALFCAHDYTKMFATPSLSMSRSMRFLDTCQQIIISLFLNTLFYSVAYPDDGICNTIQNPNICSRYQSHITGQKICKYNVAIQECSFNDLPVDLVFANIVNLITAIFTVFLTTLLNIFVEHLCRKRPNLAIWGYNTAEWVGSSTDSHLYALEPSTYDMKRLLQSIDYMEMRTSYLNSKDEDDINSSSSSDDDDEDDDDEEEEEEDEGVYQKEEEGDHYNRTRTRYPYDSSSQGYSDPITHNNRYGNTSDSSRNSNYNPIFGNSSDISTSPLHQNIQSRQNASPREGEESPESTEQAIIDYNTMSIQDEAHCIITKVLDYLHMINSKYIGTHDWYRLRHQVKAMLNTIGLYPDGTHIRLSVYDRIMYHTTEKMFQAKLKKARKRSERLNRLLESLEGSQRYYNDAIIIQQFIREHLNYTKRFKYSHYNLYGDNIIELIHPALWLLGWTVVIVSLLGMLYFVFNWGVTNAGGTFTMWGVTYANGLILDIFLCQFVIIYIKYILGLDALRAQLLSIHQVIRKAAIKAIVKLYAASTTTTTTTTTTTNMNNGINNKNKATTTTTNGYTMQTPRLSENHTSSGSGSGMQHIPSSSSILIKPRYTNNTTSSSSGSGSSIKDMITVCQHTSPTCRLAHTHTYNQLTAAKILQEITDEDIEFCKVNESKKLTLLGMICVGIPAVLSLLLPELGDKFINGIVPGTVSGIFAGSLYFYNLNHHTIFTVVTNMIFIAPYLFLVSIIWYYFAIYRPAKKRVTSQSNHPLTRHSTTTTASTTITAEHNVAFTKRVQQKNVSTLDRIVYYLSLEGITYLMYGKKYSENTKRWRHINHIDEELSKNIMIFSSMLSPSQLQDKEEKDEEDIDDDNTATTAMKRKQDNDNEMNIHIDDMSDDNKDNHKKNSHVDIHVELSSDNKNNSSFIQLSNSHNSNSTNNNNNKKRNHSLWLSNISQLTEQDDGHNEYESQHNYVMKKDNSHHTTSASASASAINTIVASIFNSQHKQHSQKPHQQQQQGEIDEDADERIIPRPHPRHHYETSVLKFGVSSKRVMDDDGDDDDDHDDDGDMEKVVNHNNNNKNEEVDEEGDIKIREATSLEISQMIVNLPLEIQHMLIRNTYTKSLPVSSIGGGGVRLNNTLSSPWLTSHSSAESISRTDEGTAVAAVTDPINRENTIFVDTSNERNVCVSMEIQKDPCNDYDDVDIFMWFSTDKTADIHLAYHRMCCRYIATHIIKDMMILHSYTSSHDLLSDHMPKLTDVYMEIQLLKDLCIYYTTLSSTYQTMLIQARIQYREQIYTQMSESDKKNTHYTILSSDHINNSSSIENDVTSLFASDRQSEGHVALSVYTIKQDDKINKVSAGSTTHLYKREEKEGEKEEGEEGDMASVSSFHDSSHDDDEEKYDEDNNDNKVGDKYENSAYYTYGNIDMKSANINNVTVVNGHSRNERCHITHDEANNTHINMMSSTSEENNRIEIDIRRTRSTTSYFSLNSNPIFDNASPNTHLDLLSNQPFDSLDIHVHHLHLNTDVCIPRLHLNQSPDILTPTSYSSSSSYQDGVNAHQSPNNHIIDTTLHLELPIDTLNDNHYNSNNNYTINNDDNNMLYTQQDDESGMSVSKTPTELSQVKNAYTVLLELSDFKAWLLDHIHTS